MNMDDIQGVFFTECEESLEAAEAGLEVCKSGEHDDETINAIFRAVHSIKGGAGAFGYMPLQSFTHCFETLLADVREGRVPLSGALIDLMLLSLDCLRDHVDAARDGADAPDDVHLTDQLAAAHAAEQPVPNVTTTDKTDEADEAEAFDLDDLLDDLAVQSSAPVPPRTERHVHLRPHAGAMRNGSDPLLWLRELSGLGGKAVHCDIAAVPALDEFDPAEGYLGWTFALPETVAEETIAEIFDFAGDDCSVAFGQDVSIPAVRGASSNAEQASPQAGQPAAAPQANAPAAQASSKPRPQAQRKSAESQSIRIDLLKLDNLIDSVGELVIAQAMLAQKLEDRGEEHLEELTMLEGLVRDIQERAMAIRAQPISSVFNRVPRLLRELAATTNKHVNLVMVGETTELDKTVIERLSEPLTHLIRNAIDHGIESTEDRLAVGKPSEGTLELSAEQRAGRILIRISDDGRGIDRAKVLQKAIEKGIVSQTDTLSDEDVDNLIFAPGFSTAQQVSNISGRGVGMDVVRQNVKDLGGRVSIESSPGEGTTFVLALPLTLAIADGMIVQVGAHSLVIPLANVVESLRPQANAIKGLGTSRQILNVRDQFVPIIALSRFVDDDRESCAPEQGVLVIVETEHHGQIALLVDDIIDQRQFLIKSLDAHYQAVPGIAGATILGDGRVALIVDVDHVAVIAKRASSLVESLA